MSEQSTHAAAKAELANGNPIPFELIWNGAAIVLDIIRQAIESRSTLRARVKTLEGVCLTQAKQIEVLETRIKALEK
jgi:hypothetical protein